MIILARSPYIARPPNARRFFSILLQFPFLHFLLREVDRFHTLTPAVTGYSVCWKPGAILVTVPVQKMLGIDWPWIRFYTYGGRLGVCGVMPCTRWGSDCGAANTQHNISRCMYGHNSQPITSPLPLFSSADYSQAELIWYKFVRHPYIFNGFHWN